MNSAIDTLVNSREDYVIPMWCDDRRLLLGVTKIVHNSKNYWFCYTLDKKSTHTTGLTYGKASTFNDALNNMIDLLGREVVVS